MSKLFIEGFKCFESIEIPIRQLTVLAGGNSVGKSSVIQLLLLMRSCFKERDDQTLLNENFLLNLGDSSKVISRKGNANNHIYVRYENDTGRNTEVTWEANISSPQPHLELKHEEWELGSVLTTQNFHYLHAERLGPRPFYTTSGKNKNVGWRGENTIALLSNDLVSTSVFDIPQNKLFRQDNKNVKLLHQVGLWMNYIIPGIEIDASRIQEINRAFVLYNEFTPYNVGFGISYVLPVIVAGLIAEKGEMLIVENPEAHLHPSGQSRIGQFLAKIAAYGVHVVIETHSEHVVNGVCIASLKENIPYEDVVINFFNKEGENTQPTVANIFIDEDADLDFWPDGFFDQKQMDIATIFQLQQAKRNAKI